ncbi:hypothetical protein HCG49_05210 [Arenibacter sp. 6A1]|uniref:DUF7009 family protein n=1 Tax=Arenibacter sp. 6A1 TaxID=2720391 RepID=UPI001444FB05|nr:hypothetical protein [Arenibacter sp. 6A1]NKI25954.1 hypothetical protein [Arenibacter sp. 6A1]
MKIRIQGNSIRYRLTRSEVQKLGQSGYIEQRTEFNGKSFIYVVRTKPDITTLLAEFKHDTITLFLPASEQNLWPQSERIGYEHKMVLNNGNTLSLLLEKDFVCLDERIEDQSDNYPNPAAAKK